jgi:ankyrin repeat protein
MRGGKFANIFIHFKPVDHDELNAEDNKRRATVAKKTSSYATTFSKLMYRNDRAGHEDSNHGDDEQVLERHREDADRQRVSGVLLGEQKKKKLRGDSINYGDIPEDLLLNIAAAKGHLHKVKSILGEDAKAIHARDMNGWQAIHEAVRSGHTDVVKYLVENGADLASLTSSGGSPLWWAKRTLEPGHSVIKYLEDLGAPEIGEL